MKQRRECPGQRGMGGRIGGQVEALRRFSSCVVGVKETGSTGDGPAFERAGVGGLLTLFGMDRSR